MLSRQRVARVDVHVIALRGNAVLLRIRVLALLPNPHQLSVVTAAAALVHRQLTTRAKARTVLHTARLGLVPGRRVQAAAHAQVRATAHAQVGIKGPTELRAAEG